MSNIANAPRYAPGKSSPFVSLNPQSIISKRAPLGFDHAEVSTLWIEGVDMNNAQVNAVWINTGSLNGSTIWTNLVGGSASFVTVNLPYTRGASDGITFGGVRTISVPEVTSIFVGQSAGNKTVTGLGNSSLGTSSLAALTSGADNTAVGFTAGQNITTGSTNTLVGELAGNAITTADNNTVLGAISLPVATTSVGNTIIGGSSGLAISTGTGVNVSLGFGNIQALTTGSGNIAIGGGVLNTLLTGAGNIAIGRAAGGNYTGAESGNIILGPDAGTLGENNVMRISSNGEAIISTTGATNPLILNTNGLVQVNAVLVNVASPTAALTANQRVIRVRFTGFTTAPAASQTFTLTSNQITLNGAVQVTVTNNNASGNGALMQLIGITQTATTLAVTCTNNGGGALGAGDDVNVTFWIID